MSERVLVGRCVSCEQMIYNDGFTLETMNKFAQTGLCLKCQKKSVKKYSCEYFINIFKGIPEELWVSSTHSQGNKLDIISYCEKKLTKESIALDELFRKHGLNVLSANNGKDNKFNQETPKQRIMAALNWIKEEENVY